VGRVECKGQTGDPSQQRREVSGLRQRLDAERPAFRHGCHPQASSLSCSLSWSPPRHAEDPLGDEIALNLRRARGDRVLQ
jgi:hypothetical protein